MAKDLLKNLKQLDLQIFRTIASHPDLQTIENIEFDTSEKHIRLRGNVRSFFEKQMAQETIRALDQNREIENELSVQWNS